MPRQSRQPSETGIYHVMMRGINNQNISDLRSSLLTLDNAQASLALYSLNRSLEEHKNYYQFLNTLDMMAQLYEPDGTPLGRNYILYAYCLMSNHIHLLIRDREDTIEGYESITSPIGEIDRNREKYDISYVMKQKPVPVFRVAELRNNKSK